MKTNNKLLASYFLISLLVVTSCSLFDSKNKAVFDVKQMDQNIRPGDDFFSYANGGWIKSTTIPNDKSRYGSFDILQEENNITLKAIFEKALTKTEAKKGSSWQKIADFYASGMDTAAINSKGIAPIREDLERINSIGSLNELNSAISHLHTFRVFPLFTINVSPDRKNTSQTILYLGQGGLGLPDRDYYLSDDDRSKEIRKEYLEHLTENFALLGFNSDESKEKADVVMQFEKRLAEVSLTRLERRNPNRTYNKVMLQEMQLLCPSIDWNTYFNQIGIKAPTDFVIDNQIFYVELGKMMVDTPIDIWKAYLTWNLVNRFSPYLSTPFVDLQFKFYGNKLSGNETNKPRWERVAGAANITIGEIVGQVFVEEKFPPEAKQRMLELVGNLKAAFKQRISQVEWMTEATKEKALEKLEVMNLKVGYPDKWKDYSNLEISRDCYASNVKRAMAFNFIDNLSKIGKPVDKTEWFMNPQTVNAYYSPTLNEIVFPAAILQPPFFNLEADDAINYGAIGVVIGHEMTHGFDDQGRLFNKDGNLQEWWDPIDSEKFNELTKTLVDQYNAFVAINDLTLDGKLTLGENIADYGGLTIAYYALQKSFQINKKPSKIDGFTPEQRFFLSYANVWKQVIRDKELMRRVKEDVHSPGRFRVNGALFNIPEFYEAFEIKETDPLYRSPEARPKIW
jgi:putative endopeptidase